MFKKQKKLIIILAVCAVFLTCMYFFVVSPLIAKWTAVEEVLPELLPGEVLGTNNRILMFEHVEKAGMQEIEVHNSYGSYTFYRGADDNFYIRDLNNTPYSLAALSSLVVSSGYTLSLTRVTTDCTDWAQYGLDAASEPAWYQITTLDGTKHKVNIGSLIPTGGGYYCSYEGRNAVYVLDSSIADTLLAPVTNLITPVLAIPLASNDYFTVRDFFLLHGEDYVIWVDYVADGIELDAPNTTCYEMKYPGKYIPSGGYETMLQTFTNFQGMLTLEAGSDENPLPDEVLEKYGLLEPAYTVHYKYNDVDNYTFFSELNEDGYYYAYSLNFNLIARVDPSKVEFLTWDLIDYVDYSTFMLNINDIATIELISDDYSETFTLEGEGTDIKITPASTGKTFGEADVKNFRQFYKTLLSIKLEGYADSTATDELLLTLRYTTDAGKVWEFKFYPYSTRRCFYTVNGNGEFYVLRDILDKAISDSRRVVEGLTVDSWAKN